MNQVKLYIAPIAIDMVNGKYFTLVINDPDNPEGICLPFVLNDGKSDIDLQIKECILNYVSVNPEWLKIQLFNKIRNKNGTLEIIYYFSIPYNNIKIIDTNKAALINFDLLCATDPYLCNIKYFI